MVTTKSHCAAIPVLTLVLLFARFGSVVPEADTVEVAVVDKAVTDEATLTVTTMLAEADAATLVVVQVIVPVAPTAGVVQFHPEGIAID